MVAKKFLILPQSRLKQLYAKKDKMHNFTHILRIKRSVARLRNPNKNINEDFLDFLIAYHGLKEYVRKHRNHFPKLYVQALLRHTKKPQTLEERLVHDANLLDNLGKQGIQKALYVGRLLGRCREHTFAYLRTCLKKGIRFYTKQGKQLGKKELVYMRRKLY